MASVSDMYDVGWEEMRDKLRKWREDNCRNSEQIVDVGDELISEHSSKLGDDVWIIYEQVMIAALDCSRDDLALTCLQELRKQFPDSHRVKRLSGMRLEALERYDEANKHYDAILQDDPTNTAARKRKISILKAQGKSAEAIRELNEYLEQFVGDQEAWHELSELYINEHDASNQTDGLISGGAAARRTMGRGEMPNSARGLNGAPSMSVTSEYFNRISLLSPPLLHMRAKRLPGLPLMSQSPRRKARQTTALSGGEKKQCFCLCHLLSPPLPP
uniref:ER membrane protein complex subunit 2 n=1 Tax=Gasterosteus aculeatus aculeatus TaxID=481459 RepID=A0AAQ4RB64_GASAC